MLKKYRSFFVLTRQDSDFILANYGQHNAFLFEEEPTKRYWQSADGRTIETRTVAGVSYPVNDDSFSLNELIVLAGNEEFADNTISVILAALELIYPDAEISKNHPGAHEISLAMDKARLENPRYCDLFKNRYDLRKAIEVWSKVKDEKDLIYALMKFKLSLELYSFDPFDANPKYGEYLNNYNASYDYHTKAAFAIIASFSAIEEIGLEIRSGPEKKRFQDKNGTWNPIVLNDIQTRLKNANVDERETTDWIFRGKPTKVEEDLKPYFGYDSEWVDGQDVRDKTLTFPEAIHNASYLRNFIAAHKFNDLTQYISPYDVFNIQSLLRELLLRKMDMWKDMAG